jgi:hypothetical protein
MFNGFPVNFSNAFAYNPGFGNPPMLGQGGQFSPTSGFPPQQFGGGGHQHGAARLQALGVSGANDLEILENLKQMIKNGQHEFYRAVPQPAALASLYLGPHREPEPQTQQPQQTSSVPPHPQQVPAVQVKTEPPTTEEVLQTPATKVDVDKNVVS